LIREGFPTQNKRKNESELRVEMSTESKSSWAARVVLRGNPTIQQSGPNVLIHLSKCIKRKGEKGDHSAPELTNKDYVCQKNGKTRLQSP